MLTFWSNMSSCYVYKQMMELLSTYAIQHTNITAHTHLWSHYITTVYTTHTCTAKHIHSTVPHSHCVIHHQQRSNHKTSCPHIMTVCDTHQYYSTTQSHIMTNQCHTDSMHNSGNYQLIVSANNSLMRKLCSWATKSCILGQTILTSPWQLDIN